MLPGTLSEDLAAASLAMARRFAGGATMWCVAPAWPQHARDVAVGFMHPAIVGRRALSAVAVIDGHPVGRLRRLAHSGDLLLAMSASDQVEVVEVMRRAPAWGLETVWIGAGVRPEPGAADHVLWVDADSEAVADTGGLVPLCHVLGELIHDCFEHHDLLELDDPAACTKDGVCVTCADEGRLGEIVTAEAVGKFDHSAVARTASGLEEIDTSLVGTLAPGDLVVIHAGTAIGLIETAGGSSK
jgi:hypothetical protein